jgi:hypothetical protein
MLFAAKQVIDYVSHPTQDTSGMELHAESQVSRSYAATGAWKANERGGTVEQLRSDIDHGSTGDKVEERVRQRLRLVRMKRLPAPAPQKVRILAISYVAERAWWRNSCSKPHQGWWHIERQISAPPNNSDREHVQRRESVWDGGTLMGSSRLSLQQED